MKELSIEQKAQRYDEALEKAKSLIKDEKLIHSSYKDVVEGIFPELKVKDDESIRKAIRYAIGQSTHSDGTLINGVSSEEALVWLEKQGKQKSIWHNEDEAKRNALISLIEEIKTQPLKRLEDWDGYISWLESLKDRYTWKPSDEQMAVLNEVINYAANSDLQHWSSFIYTLLKSLREQLKKLKEE